MKTIKLILLAALLGFTVAAQAMDDFPIRPGATSSLDELDEFIFDTEIHVLDAGAFALSVTNFGFIGNSSFGRPDAMLDPCTEEWAPQLEYPKGSGVQYMWQGGLWIGAIVETDTGDVPRVSVATEGWFSAADFELAPSSPFSNHSIQQGRRFCDGSEMFDPEAFGTQEFISTFDDTSMYTDTGVPRTHPNDGPHLPLGVEVSQRLITFSAVDYDKFAIIEYTLRNMGNDPIKDLCVGLYLDADVGLINTANYADDITGYLEDYNGEYADIAWIADNNGRGDDGEYHATSVIGLICLQSPDNTPLGGYNWWISNSTRTFDFGPAWETEDHWTDTYGTPFDDAKKYELLRNGEIDYPQYRVNDSAWIAANPQETSNPEGGNTVTHPWFTVDTPIAEDLADGFDTRFLLSWGPLGDEMDGVHRFAAGEELTLAVAVVLGDDFHNPDTPQPQEGIDPNLFNFDDLVATAQKARLVYSDMAAYAPPSPPVQISVYAGWSGTVMSWPSLPNLDGVSYNVYGRSSSDEAWPSTPLNRSPLPAPSFTQRNSFPGSGQQYRIEAIRHENVFSYPSPTFTLPEGAISPIQELTVTSGDNSVALNWTASYPEQIEEYKIYRTENPDLDFEMWSQIAAVTESAYTDNEADNGVEYWYAVEAAFENHVSLPSFSESVIPINLGNQMLVLMEYSDQNALNNWVLDDVIGFYTEILIDLEIPAGFKRINLEEADTLTLSEIADYGTVWLVYDRAFGIHTDYTTDRDAVMKHYSELGGKLLVSGKESRTLLSSTDSQFTLGPVLGFDQLQACTYNAGDSTRNFNRAVAIGDELPDLTVDPTKTFPNRITGNLASVTPSEGNSPLFSFESLGQSTQFEGNTIGLYKPATDQYAASIFVGIPFFLMAPQVDVVAAVSFMVDLIEGTATPPAPAPTANGLLSLDSGAVRVHPNPFNAATTVSMQLPYSMLVGARLYNMLGQEVWRIQPGYLSAGRQQFTVRGSDLPSGLYFLQLQMDNRVHTKKLLLLK